eukprot:704113-Lingulodinium_polyedra.AAC.1
MEAVRETAAAILETGTDATIARVQSGLNGDMNAEDIARCVENWTEVGQWVQGNGQLAALPEATGHEEGQRPGAGPGTGRKI